MSEPAVIPKDLRPVMESLIVALRSAAEALQEVIDVNDRRLLDMRYALREAEETMRETKPGSKTVEQGETTEA